MEAKPIPEGGPELPEAAVGKRVRVSTRTHTHHPDGSGPVCRYTTKRECDAVWREHLAQKKQDYATEEAEKIWAKKLLREKTFDEFIAGQERRAKEIAFEWLNQSPSPEAKPSPSTTITPSPTTMEPTGQNSGTPQRTVRVIRLAPGTLKHQT